MEKINSDKAPDPVGAYPHAKKVGNLLFLSGVGPRKKDQKTFRGSRWTSQGNIISYDIEQQCHAVFENVRLFWKHQDHRGKILLMSRFFSRT